MTVAFEAFRVETWGVGCNNYKLQRRRIESQMAEAAAAAMAPRVAPLAKKLLSVLILRMLYCTVVVQ